MPWGIHETQWFCSKQLKIAYFKHSEHFVAIKFLENFFSANHCENAWNWLQQHDFQLCCAKNCMGIPWGIPEIQWFCIKQFILKNLSLKKFFIPAKCSECLKWAIWLFWAKSLYLRYASRYSHAIFCSTVVKDMLLWPVSHKISVVCRKFFFQKILIAAKCSECSK